MTIYEDKNLIIHFKEIDYIFSLIEQKNIFLIIDGNIYNLYKSKFENLPSYVFNALESNKSIENYIECINLLLKYNIDKNSTIIAIGGGLICDFAGFVATTYKRGTKLIFIPTTLLAQVDAAIGGKNALNFDKIKNLIGTFRFPEETIICTNFLKKLNNKQFSGGIAEIIKISLISNKNLFKLLEKNELNLEDEILLKNIIAQSINQKLEIVNQDLFDKNIRIILNFGHTLAHSLESVYTISHGQAVSIGIDFSSFISLENNLISDYEYSQIQNILKKYNLAYKRKININKLKKYILFDKKNTEQKINEILINGIGSYKFQSFSIDEYLDYLNDWIKYK